ncbi:hypothetical protein B0A48_15348 [Cryoendolithus antarcticus]|uniref:Uncharacterized protein n=1 Tax=Cryoendolithus antarcticus TaxID=1507870 RepID=A0A1V8SHR5_9PEZI|nr:hypothetical protein B0A48_15348 [Cryoendolithus antarcticus]
MAAPTAVMTPNRALKRKASQSLEDDLNASALPTSIKDSQSDHVAPYNAYQESLSTVIISSNHWFEFVNVTTGIRNLVLGPLLQYKGDSHYVLETIAKAEKGFNPTVERIQVSFAGAMASGKSSSISSALHSKVAYANNASKSVTLVPTYYKQMRPHQTSAFLIEAFFLADVSIERIMSQLVKSCYIADHPAQDEGDDDDDDDDKDDTSSQDDIASMLYALLKEPAGWTSKERARDFMKSAQSRDDRTLIAKLVDWALEVKGEQLAGTSSQNESVSVECQDLKDLPKTIGRYTSDVSTLDVALWPLISHVDIYFDNPLGRMGITLLDAPGGNDMPLRANNAAPHVRSSSHMVVVTDITRASNPLFFRDIKKHKDGREDRMIVVMTKADVIDASTVVDSGEEDQRLLAALVRTKEQLQIELKSTTKQYKEGKRNGLDQSRLDLLKDRKTELKAELQKAKQAERWKHVCMRNDYAWEAMRQRLRDITKFKRDVQAIGISNTTYDVHAEGFAIEDTPLLSAEQTNIPLLRRTIYEQTVNPAMLRRAKHLFENGILGAIKEVRVFAGVRASQVLAEARQCVAVPVDSCDEHVTTCKRLILEDLKLNVLDKCDRERSSWNVEATTKCKKWRKDNNSRAFLSMMQNDGYRRAKDLDINTQLQAIHSDKVQKFFDDTSTVRSRIDALALPLEELLINMVKVLKAFAREKDLPFSDFCALVDQKKSGIKEMLREAGVRLEDSISAVKGRAVWIDADSFIGDVMRPIYVEVGEMKSTGSKKLPREYKSGGWHKWRCDEFTRKVTSDCWRKIVNSIDKALQDAVNEMYTDVLTQVKSIYQGLLDTFDSKMNGNETSDEELELHKALKANLEIADTEFKKLGPLYDAMEREFGVDANGRSTKVKDESED